MKKLFTILCVLSAILLFSAGQANAQLFQQNFSQPVTIFNNSVSSDTNYVNATTPSNSQFTYMSAQNANIYISVPSAGDTSGMLKIFRNNSGSAYFARNVALTGPPTSLIVKFDFHLYSSTGNSSQQPVKFYVGSSVTNTNSEADTVNAHSEFAIGFRAPDSFFVYPVNTNPATPQTMFQGTKTITFVINNSGNSMTYSAPDGTTEAVANDSYDLWVGTSKMFNDQVARDAAQTLSTFKLRIGQSSTSTFTFDNILITEIPVAAPPSITDNFRTKASGNWNDVNTWEESANGTSWASAVFTPNDSSNAITITNHDTVTVTSSVSVNQVTINAGGAVIVNGAPVVFTVTNGADSVDMTVNGLLKVTGTSIASPGPYSVSLAVGTVLNFGNGGVYEHNQNGGAIPQSTWGTGSTIRFTGITANAPANGNQDFYNVEWNTPAMSANLNLGWDNNTIHGNISVINTNASRWQLTAPATNDTAITTILGNIIQTGGQFSSQGTSNATSTCIINVYGDITVTAGNFSVARGSQNTTGTTTWNLYGANFSMSNATTQNSNSAGAYFVFTGPTKHNLTLSNVTFSGGFPIQVTDGSTINLGTTQLRGSGDFRLYTGATVETANAGGLDSALQNTGVILLTPGANYTFNGTAAQITGRKLPVTVNKLTINNAAGVTLTSDSTMLTVNDTLKLTNGDLSLNGKTIALGSNGMLVETAGNTVKGTTGKITITKNIGTPAGVNVGGLGAILTANKDLGSTAIERYHSAPTGGGSAGILRYYNIVPGQNNSGLSATLRFSYDESELNGISEASLVLFKSSTAANNSWLQKGGNVNVAGNYIELSGVTDFSYWAAASTGGGAIPVELSSFTASTVDKKVMLNWTTATETQNQGWNIERKSEKSTSWEKIGFVAGAGSRTETANYKFADEYSFSGKVQYRLKQMDLSGAFKYSQVIEVVLNNLPTEFALHQNYPNPFNPSTTINYDLPAVSFVNLSVYNALGQKVATLVNEQMEPGIYSRSFDASNFGSGIYFYRLTVNNNVFTKKMIMIK